MLNWLPNIPRLPAMTWWDVLDIAIVALVIYEVLKAIRGTRAIQMAAGSMLLVLMFYVSRWGHLQTIDWLIRNLLPYIVFAAIVLFQADIRRALAHFGRAPFFRYFLTQEGAEETIEEIAVAAAQLSAQRIGAIIVVERQIGLRNYIEAGLPLDAMLTYDLLVSIFQPKSPLPCGGRGLFPAAHNQSSACTQPWNTPSCSDRPDRRERFRCRHHFRRDRAHQHLSRRKR
jgi:diadenylate cyclase